MKYLFFIISLLASSPIFGQQNIILIIADDLGVDYLSAYKKDADTATTPYISQMAKNGVVFTNFQATPICSPTRAGIFTGRYSFRTGIGDVITSNTSNQLDTAEISIANLLKNFAPVKYYTANVGKWHLHANTPPKRQYPNKMGYDFYCGNFNGAISNYYYYPIIRNGITDTAKTYATTQTVNDAIDWIDTFSQNKPFFLWLAFNAPHTPYHLPPASLCDTAGLSGTAQHIAANPKKYFKAAIQAMDTEIGRLLQYLQTTGKLDSTTIIFIGDNGNDKQVAKISNTSKSKGTLFDYGIHVPLIVSGAAVTNPNRIDSSLINHVDIFATIAELADFTAWKNYIPIDTVVDSRSFLPIIKNQTANNRSWLFSEQFTDTMRTTDGKTIRNIDYQLIRFENGAEEMYQLKNDPEENDNILAHTSLSIMETANYQFLCDSMNQLLQLPLCTALAINEIAAPTIYIKENPVKALLTLISDSPIKENSIYDLFGKKVMSSAANTINTTALAAGIYVLAAKKFDNKEIYFKFIKE